jgi:5-methylcytosine-specific restriction endonuclease McrA
VGQEPSGVSLPQTYKERRIANTAACRRYRKLHPEVAYEYTKLWRAANPEKNRANKRIAQHIRRARLLNCEGRYTIEQWELLRGSFGSLCLCCGRTESELSLSGLILTPDHVRPLARGGSNSIENLQPLCYGKGGCNNRKHARWIDYRNGYVLEIR